MCGSDPDAASVDLAGVFTEVPVSAVMLAVEDGEVLYPMLTNAVNAVGVLARRTISRTCTTSPGDIAWSYADLGVEADATDADVLENHAHKTGRLRRDVLRTWSRKEPIPKQRLLDALQDDSFRVRIVAMDLALADGDAELDAEAHAVCDAEPSAGRGRPAVRTGIGLAVLAAGLAGCSKDAEVPIQAGTAGACVTSDDGLVARYVGHAYGYGTLRTTSQPDSDQVAVVAEVVGRRGQA